ncbi:hypothetical protein ABH994_006400 [Bradyrhizobium yuanmingense]|uniref:Uncharacterized protein n=1 Tax=Bradyrhizobium yuanmingense TaxID=108015 RepID=A0ABV4GJY4_9BRAD|nr:MULTISPECIES: hypothetical protein [Bradyrhizobium]
MRQIEAVAGTRADLDAVNWQQLSANGFRAHGSMSPFIAARQTISARGGRPVPISGDGMLRSMWSGRRHREPDTRLSSLFPQGARTQHEQAKVFGRAASLLIPGDILREWRTPKLTPDSGIVDRTFLTSIVIVERDAPEFVKTIGPYLGERLIDDAAGPVEPAAHAVTAGKHIARC